MIQRTARIPMIRYAPIPDDWDVRIATGVFEMFFSIEFQLRHTLFHPDQKTNKQKSHESRA